MPFSEPAADLTVRIIRLTCVDRTSEPSAAHIWGVDRDTYLAKADPWPLNPEGELMLGIKVESKSAVPHIEEILAVPGIAGCNVRSDRVVSLLGRLNETAG